MTATFIVHLVGWTAALVAAQVAAALAGGEPVLRHLPAWGGLALVLAAYPAGISIAGSGLVGNRRSLPRLGLLLAGVGTAALLLVGWVGPGLGSLAGLEDDLHGVDLGALYERARTALRAAGGAEGPHTIERWVEANRLAWHLVSRVAGALLAPLMAALGVLVGYWSGRTRRRELRLLQQWIIGLCLIVTTYLAGENSFELIVLRAAGPVYAVAWLRLVAPAVLLCGLSWTALVAEWPLLHDRTGP
jgi:hypothetical protein